MKQHNSWSWQSREVCCCYLLQRSRTVIRQITKYRLLWPQEGPCTQIAICLPCPMTWLQICTNKCVTFIFLWFLKVYYTTPYKNYCCCPKPFILQFVSGLQFPGVKMQSIFPVKANQFQVSSPWCREIPQIIKWLSWWNCKCQATGLDTSLTFLSTSRSSISEIGSLISFVSR